jgi:hypothetical protein
MCLDPGNDPQLETHHLFTDELQFIVGAMHPWAKAGGWSGSRFRARTTFSTAKQRHLPPRAGLFPAGTGRPQHRDRTRQHGGHEGTREARPRREHPRAVDRAEGIEDGSLVALPLGGANCNGAGASCNGAANACRSAEETFIGLCKSASVAFNITKPEAA